MSGHRLAALFALWLCACSAHRFAAPPLRVGTSGDYAPFSHAGRGFDLAVAQRLGRHLGRRVELVPFRWPELQAAVARSDFDLAMGGVTWRADRSLVGYLTRAVAAGGPCLLARSARAVEAPRSLAVNRGGILERFARERFPATAIRTVDDNLGLPRLLERGEVDAILTDSFELSTFRAPGDHSRCEPPTDRKVYWLAPAAAALGPRVDAWLAEQEPWLARQRRRHLGAASTRDEIDHTIDLIARRCALMPLVARAKAARELPIEDPDQEQRVLLAVERGARDRGLAPAEVRALFALEIEVARNIQRRTPVVSAPAAAGLLAPDLERELRPAIAALTLRQLDALARAAPALARAELTPHRLAPLGVDLLPAETARLAAALARIRRLPYVNPEAFVPYLDLGEVVASRGRFADQRPALKAPYRPRATPDTPNRHLERPRSSSRPRAATRAADSNSLHDYLGTTDMELRAGKELEFSRTLEVTETTSPTIRRRAPSSSPAKTTASTTTARRSPVRA